MSDNTINEFDLTDLDENQISRYKYSKKHNADRVVIVGSEGLKAEVDMSNFKMPEFKYPDPVTVEKQVVVTQVEYREIEKPVIVKEIEYREIEKPIIINKVEYKEVEVPVYKETVKYVPTVEIYEKQVFKDYPKWMQFALIVQSVAILGLLILNLVK